MTAAELLAKLEGEVLTDIFDKRSYTVKFVCLSTENIHLKLKQINVDDYRKEVELELEDHWP